MHTKACLVVTTIGEGNFLDSYTNAFFKEALVEDVSVIVIPDRKTSSRLDGRV